MERENSPHPTSQEQTQERPEARFEELRERLLAIHGRFSGTLESRRQDSSHWGQFGGVDFGGSFITIADEYVSMLQLHEIGTDARSIEELAGLVEYLEQAHVLIERLETKPELKQSTHGNLQPNEAFEALYPVLSGMQRIMLQRMAEIHDAKHPNNTFILKHPTVFLPDHSDKGRPVGSTGYRQELQTLAQIRELVETARSDMETSGSDPQEMDRIIRLLRHPENFGSTVSENEKNIASIHFSGKRREGVARFAPECAVLWARRERYFRT